MDNLRSEVWILTRYAGPLIATQLGMMAMGVVDVLMVGKLGPTPLGAVGLGDFWVSSTFVPFLGILLGIDPIISQAHGAGEGRSVALALQRGIVMALVLSLPLSLAWLFPERVLLALGQGAELSAKAQAYSRAQAFSAAPYLVFFVLRQYLQGRGMLTPALCVIVIANLLNVLLNWALIFGKLGCPALGLVGAGIATGLSRVFMMLLLVLWVLLLRLHRGAWIAWSRLALSPRGLRQIFARGAPVGIQLSLEVWAFGYATLLAGEIGKAELAAHTIVIKLASLSFMVPLGISMASVTRVGNLIGAGKPAVAQRAAWVAMGMGAGVMGVSALAFTIFREWLPLQFTADPQVVALSASILPVAAAFQLFDGTQAVGGGVLRGMGNTIPAALFNLLGYYFLALPLAAWLGASDRLGLAGIWWGLCLGLGVVAILLVVWVWKRGPARAVRVGTNAF